MPVVNVDDLVRLQQRPEDIRNVSYPSIPPWSYFLLVQRWPSHRFVFLPTLWVLQSMTDWQGASDCMTRIMGKLRWQMVSSPQMALFPRNWQARSAIWTHVQMSSFAESLWSRLLFPCISPWCVARLLILLLSLESTWSTWSTRLDISTSAAKYRQLQGSATVL